MCKIECYFKVTEYGEFGLDAFIFLVAIKLQETIT